MSGLLRYYYGHYDDLQYTDDAFVTVWFDVFVKKPANFEYMFFQIK